MPRPRPTIEKRCPDCGETQPLENFYNSKKYDGGYSPYCKPCTRRQLNKRRAENPEAARAAGRRYYARHKEARRETSRAKMREYSERMRAEQPAKWRTRKFFDGTREAVAPDVTREYIQGLFEAAVTCTCCGKPLCLEYQPRETRGYRSNPDAPSIDRVNNAKGYTRENIAVICWECNFRKTDLTLDDFRMFIKYVENFGDFNGL